jgi:O-methyltransferase
VARVPVEKENAMQMKSSVNRPLRIIFGAGNKGRMLLRVLNMPLNGDSGVLCFIDSDPQKWGSKVEDCPVMAPEYLLTLPMHSFMIYVAVGPGYDQVRDILTGYDLTENVDFVDAGITPMALTELNYEYRLLWEKIRNRSLLSDERLQVLHQFAGAVPHLSGEVAEIGVYRGGTAYLLATIFSDQKRRVRLFDTFSGIPATAASMDIHREGDFADTNLSGVAEFLQGFDNIAIHSGVFPDSVTPEADAASYCFVHVDADIYRSVCDCCEFFYPRLVQGGMLLFDDYGFATCPGVRKAVDEFFADKAHKPLYLPTGQALVINN